MSTKNLAITGHSADVRMHLTVNGHVMTIGHLGPDHLILDDPIELPPAEAEIFMSVDGQESHWRVNLLNGISPASSRVEISQIG